MAAQKFYYSGQGVVLLAPIVNGVTGAFTEIGNVPTLEISNEISKLEHKESTSGKRLTDRTIITELKAKFNLTMEDWGRKNLAIALQGVVSSIAGGAFNAAAADAVGGTGPATAADVGKLWPLKRGAIATTPAPVVKDSTPGTPLTLTPADYVLDRQYGVISLARATTSAAGNAPIVLPLRVEYTYGDQAVVALLQAARVNYALRLQAINTAESDVPMLVELWKLDFDPSKTLGLIQDEIAQFSIEGDVLADETKGSDALLGTFGRVTYYGTAGV